MAENTTGTETLIVATTETPDKTAESTQTPEVKADAVKDEGTILGGAKEEGQPEEKKAEETPVKAVVPEKYEIKASEGLTVDQPMLDKFTPVFKELGLSQEQAQKLADTYAPMVKAQVEAQQTAAINVWKETVEGWKTQTVKELGANYKSEVVAAAKAINKFGSPELRTFFDEHGIGNHPEMVKLLAKVGKTISQDTFVDGQSSQSSGSDINVMYPSMNKK